ncbi:MAG: hypothetical protein H7Z75_01965 [Ferruginibacter sp.]|nr:hypothetical protein [Cytophagales bacterium]
MPYAVRCSRFTVNRSLSLSLVLLLGFVSCVRPPGDCGPCRDRAAKNQDPNATGDPTCCLYGKTRPGVKTRLDGRVAETSGLVFVNGRLWTHNDSDGGNVLYAVDTTNGKITQTVVLEGATNVDWEDLTRSDTHLYVGDVGNNQGGRKNLRVYRFLLAALQSSRDTIRVGTETIAFSYADQTDFTPREKHNFDCEALVFAGNQLYLFTKNRGDYRCNFYALPATPGAHVARPLGGFDARGLVTGASIHESGKELVLVGYGRNLNVFLWVLSGYGDNLFLSGNRKRIKLGNATRLGQMEAVCQPDAHTWYFSGEKTPLTRARLYRMDASKWRD